MIKLDSNTAIAKLNQAIETGRAGAARAIERVMTEVPQDSVVRANALGFDVFSDGSLRMKLGADGVFAPVHDHAVGQILQRTKAVIGASIRAELFNALAVPATGRDGKLAPKPEWSTELARSILTEIYAHSTSKHLVRTVNGQHRGFLSDAYRRLDSRPLVDAFVSGCQKFGALPISGHAGEVRVTVKAIVPEIIELWPGEFVVVGVEFSNSDFGSGSVSVRSYVLRLICNNGATAEDVMTMRHLGKRLDERTEFSARTYQLDTQATVSALSDLVKLELGAGKREELVKRVRLANESEVSWGKLRGMLSKQLTKGEVEAVRSAFEGPDVVNLPPEPTYWRASNALSWVAHTIENPARKLEFEKLAGAMMVGEVVDPTEQVAA